MQGDFAQEGFTIDLVDDGSKHFGPIDTEVFVATVLSNAQGIDDSIDTTEVIKAALGVNS